MSQIPFVKLLGDELDRVASEAPAGGRRPRRTRRFLVFGAVAALAVSGTAAATGLFSDEIKGQASAGVQCYDGANGDFRGSFAEVPQTAGSAARSPVEMCRELMSSGGRTAPPLVACASRSSVAVIPGREPADCTAAGFAALDVRYESTRVSTARLERQILAAETSADCVAPAQLVRRVQVLLDRAGWAGWTAREQGRDGGPCGSVSGLGGDGRRYVTGSFDAQTLTVNVRRTASRRLTDLLFSADRSLLVGLFDESGAQCFTLAELRARAEAIFGAKRIDVTMQQASLNGGQLIDTDGRWSRYLEGCAILAGAEPGDTDHSAVIQYFLKDA